MKICIFGDASSVHLQRIVPGLVERQAEVHVVSHKSAQLPGATVERFCIPKPSLKNPRRWTSRWRHYLDGFLKKFDVVHIHFLHDWGFTPDQLEAGCVIATPWGSDIVPPPGEECPSQALTMSRIDLLQSAKTVAVWGAKFAAEVARFASIDEESIDLLPLGVDTSLFDPGDRATSRQDDVQRVGFFKGFRPVYGPTYLMRAMPTVVEEVPNVRFHMIGDGPQLVDCKRLSGLYEVENHVKWIRRQPYGNMPNYLSMWDLTVIPSVCESFGAAALESSAMRVPVVASDVGGLSDTVRHDETGLLVPSKAPEQLADAIIQLLQDGKRRVAMGNAGREMVRRQYEWDTILDKWMSTYTAALDKCCVMA